MDTILTKYRPQSFEEFLGNTASVKALSEAVKSQSRPRTYLFSGPSGVGKTTLARIIGKEVDAFVEERDAATNSGVEDSRNLVEFNKFKPITGKPASLIIVDECHALTKNAWTPLLKLTEEPPPWLYICLATTELDKVPNTILTRSYHCSLKLLKSIEIEELVTTVSDLEGWTLQNGTFQGIVRAAGGSARMALTILQAGHGAASLEELGEIVAKVETDKSPAIQLARLLLSGNRNWKRVAELLNEISGDEEAAIFQMSRYFASALPRSEEEQAKQVYVMLRSFTETNSWDSKIQFYSAIGKILWGQLPF